MARSTFYTRTPLGVVALGALALACTGVVGGEEEKGSGPGGPSGTGATGSGGIVDPGVPLTEDPGRKDMHRLNTAEYNATVKDVLGTQLQPANPSWRGGEIDGWDNIASQLGVDDTQYERYFTAANDLAEEFFANPALKARYVTCATTDDATCVNGIINNAGLHIFRRPLSTEEVATYFKAYQGARTIGDDHDQSLKVVLRALLSSAEFLYRIEIDPDPASTTPHAVTAYELASRLSYFLWSSAPDDALLAAAADSSLVADAGLGAAVDRMLTDAKAQRLIENFAGQWLGGRKIAEKTVDPAVYPDWNPDLAGAAQRELYAYFGEFLSGARPWNTFLSADVNFLEPPLAALYGVAGTGRTEVTTDTRYGFLGLGGFLAASSVAARTSPTLRGRWILQNLLCNKPADPPPMVPELEEQSADLSNLSIREKLEAHRANPACAGCHSIIDPYGLALEEYDGIGKYRTSYPDGTPIDASAVVPPTDVNPQGLTFSGLNGLSQAVGADPRFMTCVGSKLLTYGLGRLTTESDKPYLKTITDAWAANPTLPALIRSLALSAPFRYRHGGT
jgi:hypothetical protein